jgi:argininosuccinate synthase
MSNKVVLAYSGGLDTSIAIPWLEEKYGVKVIPVIADVGQQSGEFEDALKRAKDIGAIKTYNVDVKKEFAEEYIWPALKANALYEGDYPIATALARPLISKKLVEVARKEKADYIAHGCTAKGNDQVRFETSIRALAPHIKIIAPAREWGMTREDEIDYAKEHGIKINLDKKSPYSLDENLWGKSIESGVLEDLDVEVPEGAYTWTTSPEKAPAKVEYLTITFENGVPVKLNGKAYAAVDLINKVSEIAGKHGIGRIDHIENRLIGIKSREIYECPAAKVLIKAHKELEDLTLTRELGHFKQMIEPKYSEIVYYGLWFDPLREALDAFMNDTQKVVSGEIKLKLYKGNATIAGRKSEHSLYDKSLATYSAGDLFDHSAATGFLEIWGLPSKVSGMVRKKTGKDKKSKK